MKAQARNILRAALTAARCIDPTGVEIYEAALAADEGRDQQSRSHALLLNQAETAKILGCSRWTVRNLVTDGVLKPISLRGAKKYRRSEVEAIAGGAS